MAPPTLEAQPPVLDAGAKYGLAGRVVNALHPFNEADEASVLTEYLTLFGTHLGLAPHIMIGKTAHYARIFMVVVGQSGSSRKGSTFNLVRSVFDEFDRPFFKVNTRKNVGSDQGLISAAMHSIEWAQETLGEDDGRLVIVEPEFATLLRGGTLQRTSPMIRDAWDSNSLQSTVKRARVAEPIHLSFIGMITLDELRLLLQSHTVQSQVSNGLFNRFLTVVAQQSKMLPLDKMAVPERTLERLAEDTRLAIASARRRSIVPIAPSVMSAQFKWRQEMQKRREKEMKRAKIASRMFDLLNRGETYLLRLGLIYAMLEDSGEVRMPHYEAAEALWSYIEGSVRYVFEIPEYSLHAQQVIALLDPLGPAGLTAAQVRKGLADNSYYRPALDELMEAGIVQETERKNPSGRGRPQKVYRLSQYAAMDVDLSLAPENP